jgi:hypothetical protein
MENLDLIVKYKDKMGAFYNQDHYDNPYKLQGEFSVGKKDNELKERIKTNPDDIYNLHFVSEVDEDIILIKNCKLVQKENGNLIFLSTEYGTLKTIAQWRKEKIESVLG